jgi:hypothetical protein
MINNGSVITLKDGRKGKIIGNLESGEYMLISGKGGQVSYFTEDLVIEIDCNRN